MRNTNVVIFFRSSSSMWVVFSLLLSLSFGSYFAYFPAFNCDKPLWGPCLFHTWLRGWQGAAHPSHQSIIGHGEQELFFLNEKPPSNGMLRLIKMTSWGNLVLSAIPYIPLFGKPLTFTVSLQIFFLLSHRLIPNRCLFFPHSISWGFHKRMMMQYPVLEVWKLHFRGENLCHTSWQGDCRAGVINHRWFPNGDCPQSVIAPKRKRWGFRLSQLICKALPPFKLSW